MGYIFIAHKLHAEHCASVKVQVTWTTPSDHSALSWSTDNKLYHGMTRILALNAGSCLPEWIPNS